MTTNREMVGLAKAHYTLKYHESIKMFKEIILYIYMYFHGVI